MFKLNTKSDTRSLLYSLSHFEFYGHTIHMLTQWYLPPPLTSTVKSSLFTHAHSSPLSSAARLHRCRANHPRYINNGWTFSGQTSYVYLYVCIMEARKLWDRRGEPWKVDKNPTLRWLFKCFKFLLHWKEIKSRHCNERWYITTVGLVKKEVERDLQAEKQNSKVQPWPSIKSLVDKWTFIRFK